MVAYRIKRLDGSWYTLGEGGIASTPVSPDPGVTLTPGRLPPYSGALYGDGTNGALDGDPTYWNVTGNEHIAFTGSGYFDLTTFAGWEVPDYTTWTGFRFVVSGAITEMSVGCFASSSSLGVASAEVEADNAVEVVIPWTEGRLISEFESGALSMRVSVVGTGKVYSAEMLFGYPVGSAFYTEPVSPGTQSTGVPTVANEAAWRAYSCRDGQPLAFTDAQFLWDVGASLQGGWTNFQGGRWDQTVAQDATLGQKETSEYRLGIQVFNTASYPAVSFYDDAEAGAGGAFPGAIGAINANGDWWTNDGQSASRGEVTADNFAGITDYSDLTVSASVTAWAVHNSLDGSSFGDTDIFWTLRAVGAGALVDGPHASFSAQPPGTSLFLCEAEYGDPSYDDKVAGTDWIDGPNVTSSVVNAKTNESAVLTFAVGLGYARSDGLLGIQPCLDTGSRTSDMIEGNGSTGLDWDYVAATRTYTPATVRYIYAATGWEGSSGIAAKIRAEDGGWYSDAASGSSAKVQRSIGMGPGVDFGKE